MNALDPQALQSALDTDGYALTPPLLAPAECAALAALYDDPHTRFRSTVRMARHGFGQGEYRYFDYPLPAAVQRLRETLYPPLAQVANAWAEQLGATERWPDALDALQARCRDAGQCRPTPLLLRYREGDYNCLHQDLYGAVHFPLQAIVLLSAPGVDFDGGELVLVEQRPRMQSRATVVPLVQGQAAIVPVRERPRRGTRGTYRTQLRHGVSTLRAGLRHTLGVIFHDAA
ncbi:MAG TPA: 2OG-Fe(II) oxygenase [Lysobacter sp.]|nr:2OG-Fe(II) oxygenase [Lysobacter sp.]